MKKIPFISVRISVGIVSTKIYIFFSRPEFSREAYSVYAGNRKYERSGSQEESLPFMCLTHRASTRTFCCSSQPPYYTSDFIG
jgi:hypothetical protein